MRLTLVTYSLGCGGAQRVLTTLANGWRRAGHAVTIVALRAEDEPPFFRLDPAVSVDWLAVAGDSRHPLEAVARNLVRVQALRAAFRRTRPDVVVSFLNTVNVLVLLATAGGRIPVIVSERNDPGLKPLHRAWRWLRNRVYGRARAIVVQTRRTAEWFPPRLRRRMVVIPNAVALPDRPAPPENGPGPRRDRARGRPAGAPEGLRPARARVRAGGPAARRLAVGDRRRGLAAGGARGARGGVRRRRSRPAARPAGRHLERLRGSRRLRPAVALRGVPERADRGHGRRPPRGGRGLPHRPAGDRPPGTGRTADSRPRTRTPSAARSPASWATRICARGSPPGRSRSWTGFAPTRFNAGGTRWSRTSPAGNARRRDGRSDPDEPRSPASEGRAAELDERDQGEGNLQEEDPDE